MKYYFRDFELSIPKEVYSPLEDSELLAENLKITKGEFVLDLGCGSGLQSLVALSMGANVLAVDLSETALEVTLKNASKYGFETKLETRKSDLFEKISEKFDTIIFNPPYVASEKMELMSVDGGRKGRKTLDKFLNEFSQHLKPKGECFFLQSNLNGLKETENKLKKQNLTFEIMAKKKLFFEELIVFKVFR